ncbi:MAG: class I SAM-dependent methyltransferase [Flavipsychrobacter sp.]|nr:class I SAM-dependent methyltransferase [Flavipsychrobacter sp.]
MMEAAALFNLRAREYQEKFMDTSLYHHTFRAFCDYILKHGAHILELACGPGNITQYLIAARPDFQLLCTDIAPQMLELAKANNPSANYQLLDCRDIGKLTQQFDGIMCGFVLPYISRKEAAKLIADTAKLLHPGGVLYLSTMEGDYDMSGMQTNSYGDEVQVYYHDAEWLSQNLRRYHFTVTDIQRFDSPGANGVISRDLIIIATKAG